MKFLGILDPNKILSGVVPAQSGDTLVAESADRRGFAAFQFQPEVSAKPFRFLARGSHETCHTEAKAALSRPVLSDSERSILAQDSRAFAFRGVVVRLLDASEADCRREDIEIFDGGEWRLVEPACLDAREIMSAALDRYFAARDTRKAA